MAEVLLSFGRWYLYSDAPVDTIYVANCTGRKKLWVFYATKGESALDSSADLESDDSAAVSPQEDQHLHETGLPVLIHAFAVIVCWLVVLSLQLALLSYPSS